MRVLLILLWLPTLTLAESARDIVERMDAVARSANDSSFSLSVLSSCKYGKTGSGVACISEPKVKKMEGVQRQLGKDNRDSQALAILLEPVSERGIGMLTYSYNDPKRDTESWLYLSALGKVKRMLSGEGEDREPVALFGSEFTTEDMETGKTDEYEYKILQEGPYMGNEVWVIEERPKPERLRKSRYSKSLFWVDKQRYLLLKAQSYDKYGNPYKRIVAKDHEKINNLWISRDVTIFNLQSQRLSNMRLEKIALGIEIDPGLLTQRTLTDFAFREKVLQRLRPQLQ